MTGTTSSKWRRSPANGPCAITPDATANFATNRHSAGAVTVRDVQLVVERKNRRGGIGPKLRLVRSAAMIYFSHAPQRGATMSYGYRFLKGLLITGASFGFTLYADGLTQTCSAPQFPQPAATNIDSVCGAAGSGGKEANQNQAKNNFCPTAAAKPITIPDMVALQNKAQAINGINFGNTKKHPLTKNPGPVVNRQPLVALGEGNEVVLQGYVLICSHCPAGRSLGRKL